MQKHSINDYSVTISIYLNLPGYNSGCPKNFPLIMTDVWSHTISTDSLIYFHKPSVSTRLWKQKLPTMCPESLTPNIATKWEKKIIYALLHHPLSSWPFWTASHRILEKKPSTWASYSSWENTPNADNPSPPQGDTPNLRIHRSKGTITPGKLFKMGIV